MKKEKDRSVDAIGKHIYLWRIIKGIEQKDLASRIGKSVPSLSNYETGVSKPSLDVLEDIADALGLNLLMLFTDPNKIIDQNVQNNS